MHNTNTVIIQAILIFLYISVLINAPVLCFIWGEAGDPLVMKHFRAINDYRAIIMLYILIIGLGYAEGVDQLLQAKGYLKVMVYNRFTIDKN